MSDIQEKMFKEIRDESLFEQSKKYGVDYLLKVFDRNVYPEDSALSNLSIFDEELSDGFTSSKDIIELLHKYGSPATNTQVGGRYFGFVNGGIVPAGLASKILASFWDQNSAMQVLSPISSKLESVVEKWLKQIFNLPERTAAGFVSGTSMATFCGLAAARFRLLQRKGWNVNDKGLSGAPKIRVVAGNQAHSTVLKTIGLLGFGKDNVEWIDSDEQGRIDSGKVTDLDDNTLLILQAGNVNSGSYDNFEELCKKGIGANAWVHIDGAFGLWAQAVDKLKHLTKGIEMANSWGVDGHKTLNTPYDSGIILCEDREALVSALHMTGSYIVVGEDRDGMYYTPEMSRRARIIELWATMKSLGKEGISEMIYGLHERAVQFAKELKAAGFEILNDVVFNQVLVHCKDNKTTLEILREIQRLRVCWCGGSKWNGKEVIRISVCSWATTTKDVSLSVDSFIEARKIVTGK